MSRNQKLKFLVDENISPLTVKYLKELKLLVTDLIELNKKGIKNGELVEIAQKGEFIIITQDLDFGEIYYFSGKKKFGAIVVKLKNPTIEKMNSVLGNFFKEIELTGLDLTNSLIILDEKKYRIRK